MSDVKRIWADALKILETGTNLVSYEVWLSSLEPVDLSGDTLVMVGATGMAVKVVTEKYIDTIRDALLKVAAGITDVKIITTSELAGYLKDQPQVEQLKPESDADKSDEVETPSFNPKYTFDNFVVGKSNQVVFAAARSVTDNPGKSYNPLFVYGGSGLGKTHIMHAIGNHLKKERPGLKLGYVTSESFVNELVDALRQSAGKEHSARSFRSKYRKLDVLMIDDIQFFAGKITSQEEFFHTFNELQQAGRQIILSSDRHPKFLSELEERLRSRFQMGLIVDIQPPEMETRLAILKKKAESEKYNVDDNVYAYIAERMDSNVREMEGLLARITFYASLLGCSRVTMDIAVDALKDFFDNKKESLTVDRIVDAVCKYYAVRREDLIGKKKNKEIVEPRQVCMYIITEMMRNVPLAAIGATLGGRDHTTVMHARDKIAELTKTSHNVASAVKDIKDMILKI